MTSSPSSSSSREETVNDDIVWEETGIHRGIHNNNNNNHKINSNIQQVLQVLSSDDDDDNKSLTGDDIAEFTAEDTPTDDPLNASRSSSASQYLRKSKYSSSHHHSSSKSPSRRRGRRQQRRRTATARKAKTLSNATTSSSGGGSITIDKSGTMTTTDDSNRAVVSSGTSTKMKRISKETNTTTEATTTTVAAAIVAAAIEVTSKSPPMKTPKPSSKPSASKKYIYSPPTREIFIPLTGSHSSSSSSSSSQSLSNNKKKQDTRKPRSRKGNFRHHRKEIEDTTDDDDDGEDKIRKPRSRKGNFRHRKHEDETTDDDDDDDDEASSSELAAKHSNRSLSSGVSALTIPTSLDSPEGKQQLPNKNTFQLWSQQDTTIDHAAAAMQHQLPPSVPSRYISSEISDTETATQQTNSPKPSESGTAAAAAAGPIFASLLMDATRQPTLKTPPVSFNDKAMPIPKNLKLNPKAISNKITMAAVGEVTPPRFGKRRNISQPTPPLRKRSINGDIDLDDESASSSSQEEHDLSLAEHLPEFPLVFADDDGVKGPRDVKLAAGGEGIQDDDEGYDEEVAKATTQWPSSLHDIMSSPSKAPTPVAAGGRGRWKLEPRHASKKKGKGGSSGDATKAEKGTIAGRSTPNDAKPKRRSSSLERKKPTRQLSGNKAPPAAASTSRTTRQAINEAIAFIVSPKKKKQEDEASNSDEKEKVGHTTEVNRGRRRFIRSERSRSNPRRSITPSVERNANLAGGVSATAHEDQGAAPRRALKRNTSKGSVKARERSMTPSGTRHAKASLSRQSSHESATSSKSKQGSEEEMDPLSLHTVKRYDSIELAKGLKPKGQRKPRRVMPSIDWSPSQAKSPSISNRSLSPDRVFEPTYSLGSFTKRLAHQAKESNNQGSLTKNASLTSQTTPTTAALSSFLDDSSGNALSTLGGSQRTRSQRSTALSSFLDDSSGNVLSTLGGSQRTRSQRSTVSLSGNLSAHSHRSRNSSGNLSVNSFSPPSKPPVHPSSTRSLQSSASSRPPLTSPSSSARSSLRSSLHSSLPSLGSSMGSLRSIGSINMSDHSGKERQNAAWTKPKNPSRSSSPSRQEIVSAMEQRNRKKLEHSMVTKKREESWRNRREQSIERVNAILTKDGPNTHAIAAVIVGTKGGDSNDSNNSAAVTATTTTLSRSDDTEI